MTEPMVFELRKQLGVPDNNGIIWPPGEVALAFAKLQEKGEGIGIRISNQEDNSQPMESQFRVMGLDMISEGPDVFITIKLYTVPGSIEDRFIEMIEQGVPRLELRSIGRIKDDGITAEYVQILGFEIIF